MIKLYYMIKWAKGKTFVSWLFLSVYGKVWTVLASTTDSTRLLSDSTLSPSDVASSTALLIKGQLFSSQHFLFVWITSAFDLIHGGDSFIFFRGSKKRQIVCGSLRLLVDKSASVTDGYNWNN